jgi:hypothetical protein
VKVAELGQRANRARHGILLLRLTVALPKAPVDVCGGPQSTQDGLKLGVITRSNLNETRAS